MRMQRIAMMVLLLGVVAGTAQGQTDPYGGRQDPRGQDDGYRYPQQDDRYGRQAQFGYDRERGRPELDVGFFYGELSPYGEWLRHPYYGWVWFPRHVRAGWRPYSIGRWVGSEYGWMWVSQEPWGWATYHYGRWAWDRWVGWLWVPGTDWAPAWVAWQQGHGYIGWAPLPPAVGFDLRVGIRLGGFNLSLGIEPRHYAFIPERRFLDTRLGNYIVPEARNVTIINYTTNITNYTVVNNQVINHGVPIERVEQMTGMRAPRLHVATASSPRETSVQRESIRVYRPTESKLESVKVARRNNAGLAQAAPTADWSEAQQQAPTTKPSAGTSMGRESAPVFVPVAPRSNKPTAREESEQEFQREKKELEANEAKERRELEKIQRQEMSQAKARADINARANAQQANEKANAQVRAAANAEDVAKRHQAELQAQKEKRESAERQLQVRQQIRREAAQVKEPEQQKSEQPAEGQGKSEKDKKEEKGKKGGEVR